jgi:hypothetical protein
MDIIFAMKSANNNILLRLETSTSKLNPSQKYDTGTYVWLNENCNTILKTIEDGGYEGNKTEDLCAVLEPIEIPNISSEVISYINSL